MANELISVVQPVGYSCSTCGYCSDEPGLRSTTKSSKHYGLFAHQISPRVYQAMMDNGWRRSGSYTYLPDNSATCCPQYTIRLDATAFKASKSQRQLLNRFHKELWSGEAASRASTRKGKGRANDCFDLIATFDAIDASPRFSVRTEPASFSEAKYELYKLYQAKVHNDDDATESGFRRFLCDSPLQAQPNGTDPGYGSFHQLYFLDDKLVAIGVIDITSVCISSVYFIWHPDHAALSLGKVGALREIAVVQRLHERLPDLRYYYMGYYIHSCAKMRYKAEYGPSSLLDPVARTFHDLPNCKGLLDQHNRALFATSSISAHGNALSVESTPDENEADEEGSFPSPAPSGWLNPSSLPAQLSESALVWEKGRMKRLVDSQARRRADSRREARECLAALGPDLSQDVVLYLR